MKHTLSLLIWYYNKWGWTNNASHKTSFFSTIVVNIEEVLRVMLQPHLAGQLLFDWPVDVSVVPVPYRKSLSWNTLRARKRAEGKDGSSLALRGQENGLLRKPKETTPPPPLALQSTRAKGKVSRAHAADVVCVCRTPVTCPAWFIFVFLLNLHVCVQTFTHIVAANRC